MNFDIIIGCNLINANLTITPDSVMFSKLQIEVSDASPQPFVFATTDDIPKFDIGPEIPKTKLVMMLRHYSYVIGRIKLKTTDIELSITMTDDKPIYHSPKTVTFTERDIVDKQIDEWIQNGVIEPCSSAYASQVLVVRKRRQSTTVIDSFTKFVWLYPTKTTSTSEVIKKLDIQKTTFGNPRFLITDRGTTFTSDEFHTYCSEQKITLHHITTGLPRANGQVERINRTIIPVLSKMSEDDPNEMVQTCSFTTRSLKLNIPTKH
ncbi:pro-Pol polyprotein [Trichonephila clavipes]|nr:pro-Pol polyprotein [Trichonephila clavipes]